MAKHFHKIWKKDEYIRDILMDFEEIIDDEDYQKIEKGLLKMNTTELAALHRGIVDLIHKKNIE